MRVLLTVAPGRYTPADEVERLLGPIEPALRAAGADTVRWLPPAMPWLEWVAWRDSDPLVPEGCIVGFDLPACVTRGGWSVNIAEHPCHFAGDWWSIRDTTGPLDTDALAGALDLVAELPAQERAWEETGAGAFAAQVSFDQALMRNGRSIRPEDVMEGLRAFAHRFETLFVAPSPREPVGPWVEAALSIHNAALSPWPTYDLLRRVRHVCTVTSSVGAEAPYFGVETFWLARPAEHGAPVRRLDDPRLWDVLLARAAGRAAA